MFLDILKLVIWPAAALLFGTVSVFVFRQPLTRFIDRSKKIGFGKGLIEAPHQEPSTTPSELEQFFSQALLEEYETTINNQLITLAQEKTGQKKEDILKRYLAIVVIGYRFERIYRLIFGSQLNALHALNGMASLSPEVLRQAYDAAVEQEPVFYSTYSFDQWRGFLENEHLITHTNGQLSITLAGREFLGYLIKQGYSSIKAG